MQVEKEKIIQSGLATSYSGEFGEILFKHRQVRCKKKHILPPQAATSQVKR